MFELWIEQFASCLAAHNKPYRMPESLSTQSTMPLLRRNRLLCWSSVRLHGTKCPYTWCILRQSCRMAWHVPHYTLMISVTSSVTHLSWMTFQTSETLPAGLPFHTSSSSDCLHPAPNTFAHSNLTYGLFLVGFPDPVLSL